MASERVARALRVFAALLGLALAGCYDGDPSAFREAVVASRDKVTGLSVSAPASVIEVGTHVALVATASTAGGGTRDESRDVSWRSSAPGVLAVDDRGRVTALADGTAVISAHLAAWDASVSLVASSAALQAITVSGAATVDECRDILFTASGHYDDGTDRDITGLVAWSVGDAAVARMSSLAGEHNRLLAKDAGATTIMASRGGIDSAAYALQVLDTLTALAVTPADPPELAVGDKRVFAATGTWGGVSANVSREAQWSVTNDDTSADRIASVASGDNSPGELTAESGGTGTLTATCGGLSSSVPVTVTYLTSLAITNQSPITMPANGSLLLVLEGTYSDGSTKSLNEQATWTATATSGTVVEVSNTAGSRGKVTASGAGVSLVTATVSGKSVSVSVSAGN